MNIHVIHKQVFTIVNKSSTLQVPVKFFRFKKIVKTDYMFMGTGNYDGIVFIPKVNITFFGWGLFASYRGHDQTFNIRWKIDGEYSDKHIVSFVNSERDLEMHSHEVDLRNIGVAPIFIPAGTQLNLLAYPQTDDMRRTYYGDQGRSDYREQIPNQDNIFDIVRSDERYDTSENYG